MTSARRPDPDFLLRLARQDSGRGLLKVYLGMAAGVGKTVRMLQDARQMRAAGVDIVIGLVDTHGRSETAAEIGDLETVPLRSVSYRGIEIQEMDLDAVLARRPAAVVVDELAHTNAPGSKNEKRWQDVQDLLDAGLTVLTAVNVQHLEGVQDVVRSIVGLEVRERVPDRIVREASTIVVIDLPVRDLIDRMRRGKVYPAEQAERALANFFREEPLLRLRELALVQTADIVNVEAATDSDEPRASPRVAAAIPFDPELARSLLLRASRIAGRLNHRWFAIYVRRHRDHPENLTAAQHRALTDNVQLAMSLGGSVIIRESEDIVGTILDVVTSEKVSLLVVGAPRRRGLLGRIAPGIVTRLLRAEARCDILVAWLDE